MRIYNKARFKAIFDATSNLKHKAVILFMLSSGTARQETVKLIIQDFIVATQDYHSNESLTEVLTELETQNNIIPL